MLRRMFLASFVLASLALLAILEVSAVHAGPSSGGRSYRYRVGGDYSYSTPAPQNVVPGNGIVGDFTPAYNPEAVFYAYYAPAVRSSAGGEEESDAGQNAVARIELTVPAGAEVWVDGHRTSQLGSMRSFVTPPLQHGKAFTYDLRVRWTTAAGIVVDVTRTIEVRAARLTMVGFKQ
jgi:uncharacterized protein (TIGR03000 family)